MTTYNILYYFPKLDVTIELILLVLSGIILCLSLLAFLNMRKKSFLEFSPPNTLKSEDSMLRMKITESEEKLREFTDNFMKAPEEYRNNELLYKAQNQQLRDLSTSLEKAREEERKRISREIHDELGQQLTAIKMDLKWILKKAGSPDIKERTEGLVKLVDQTVATVKKIATELRPGILDDLGLLSALEWQCGEFEKRSGIECRFNSALEDIGFEKDFSTTVFRIFQEALTNIAKHSKASKVDIKLYLKEGQLFLEVHDNGRGIMETETGQGSTLGILGMKERARLFGGDIMIFGSREKGTVLKLQIPVLTQNDK